MILREGDIVRLAEDTSIYVVVIRPGFKGAWVEFNDGYICFRYYAGLELFRRASSGQKDRHTPRFETAVGGSGPVRMSSP